MQFLKNIIKHWKYENDHKQKWLIGWFLWLNNTSCLFNVQSYIYIYIYIYILIMDLSLIGIILRWGFLIWELIFIYCGLFCPHLGRVFFLYCFFFHYVSAKFPLWPSSGDLPQPRIGMLSLVTVSLVITAFHSCCQRIQALSLYGSKWALSEDSGFKSYPSRPEVYLVKNVVQ